LEFGSLFVYDFLSTFFGLFERKSSFTSQILNCLYMQGNINSLDLF